MVGYLIPDAPVTSLNAYLATGGGEAFQRALDAPPDETIDVIRRARLRGRGGAGFPTAVKWRGVRNSDAASRYVCANGAEGEPGTFKDRYLLMRNPYQMFEGLSIAAHVVGARAAYLGVKRAFEPLLPGLARALEEMRSRTPMARDVEIVWGPDEYLFGEEKALLAVIEGDLPLPRVLPPFIQGLFAAPYAGPSPEMANPTVVNNVETLSHVPHIVRNGADWFRRLGTEESPGTMVFTVLGDVRRPTVRELPLGMTVRDLIDGVAGGVREGRRVRAVFPGLANAVITEPMLDAKLGFDSMRRAGSALGSGGFVVFDDTACMVRAAAMFSRFLHVESCNQCPPCKLGSERITTRLERLLAGESHAHEVDEIVETATWVTNGQRCYLPTSESLVVDSVLAAFPEDFQAHLDGTCRRRHDLALPKITAYEEGVGFTYDATYEHKRPDWTYA